MNTNIRDTRSESEARSYIKVINNKEEDKEEELIKYQVERAREVQQKEKDRSETPIKIFSSASFNELSKLLDNSIQTIDCRLRYRGLDTIRVLPDSAV